MQEVNDNIQLRDVRQAYFCWQQMDAMRILYETHTGVESRNLISLYVALTMKSFQSYGSDFYTTTQDLINYTHLSKDWVPEGLRILEKDKLIKTENVRDTSGHFAGKQISLLTVYPADHPRLSDNGFLGVGKLPLYNSNTTNIKEKKEEYKYSSKEAKPLRGQKENFIQPEVWEEVKDVFYYAQEKNLFSNRLPKEVGDETPIAVTKTVLNAIQDMFRMKDSKFLTTYGLASKNLSASNYKQCLYDALDAFEIMKNDVSVWPVDKSKLPKTISSWLMNPTNGFSWFLKCLDEGPSKTREVMLEKSVSDEYKDKYYEIFVKWWDEYNFALSDLQKLSLKVKISKLIEEHKKIWDSYGQYYAKNTTWRSYFGDENPTIFLKTFVDYLRENAGTPDIRKISPYGYTFDNFKAWIRNEHNFNITMKDSEYEQFVNKHTKPVIKAKPATKEEIEAMLSIGM